MGAGGGGSAVSHLGLFDFTGAFREKRLEAASYQQIAAHGWRFIDALPYWMHDDTCFAEKGFIDEAVTIDPDTVRPYPFEPAAQLVIADTVSCYSIVQTG